jgi:hypothetical protein
MRRKLTQQMRGYGREHQARRAAVAPFVNAGMAVCSRCFKSILPGEPWDLDHTADRTGVLGPAHASCNRSAGARARNRGPSRDWLGL